MLETWKIQSHRGGEWQTVNELSCEQVTDQEAMEMFSKVSRNKPTAYRLIKDIALRRVHMQYKPHPEFKWPNDNQQPLET